MFLENHMEGVTFQPHEAGNTVEVRVDSGASAPEESHFFVAVCANRSQVGNPTFVYVPRAANVLRERERHIDLLDREVSQKNDWLETAKSELARLQEEHEKQTEELKRSNLWAEGLNRQVQARAARVAQLQEELASDQRNAREVAEGYAAKIRGLEADIREKTQWAIDVEANLKADVARQTAELVRAVDALHRTEKELDERTAWARRLEAETQTLQHQLALFRKSRWVKLGRKVGLGPAL
jgi:chromosome segregation ATPase